MNLLGYLKVGSKYFPWVTLTIVAILFVRQCGQEPEVEYRDIIVTIPETTTDLGTIKNPAPILVSPKTLLPRPKEIDSTIYKKYQSLKDSVERTELFKEVITINEYKETFEDEKQSVEVYSKARGTLLEQSVISTIKKQQVEVKDGVEVKKKPSLFLGIETGFLLNANQFDVQQLTVKGQVQLLSKRGNITSLGYDTDGRIWVGKSFKIF